MANMSHGNTHHNQLPHIAGSKTNNNNQGTTSTTNPNHTTRVLRGRVCTCACECVFMSHNVLIRSCTCLLSPLLCMCTLLYVVCL